MIERIVTDTRFRNSMEIQDYQVLDEFYNSNQYSVQWFSAVTDISKRIKLFNLISEPGKYMLEPGKYHLSFFSTAKILTTLKDTLLAEIKYTDAALSFLKDIAYCTEPMVKYNGWEYQPGCIAIAYLLQQALTNGDFEKTIKETEPENIQYREINSAYQRLYNISTENNFNEIVVVSKTISLNNKNLVNKLKQLAYMNMEDTTAIQLSIALNRLQAAHNLPVQDTISTTCLVVLNKTVREKLKELRWNVRWYRWLNCMQNKSYILINIAATRLTLIECNKEQLVSRIIVGKKSTPSPTLTSLVRNVIYYPYWNVPYDIATREMLPKLKRNPAYLDALKIEVFQGNHLYTSSTVINWKNYSARNFPFSLRQLPGCHNSLGLLKFDYENPFHAYLHDTNNKMLFNSKKRFFSHGCIRVEKPNELALLLGVPAEMINMDSCLTGMNPQSIPLHSPIPIFVIYATVDVIDGSLSWFEDTYRKREH